MVADKIDIIISVARRYDVVIISLVLEGASSDHEQYHSNIMVRLGKLVMPGGTIILFYGVENKVGYYSIGGRQFPNLHVTAEFALETLKGVGFYNLTIKLAPKFDSCPNCSFWFISGTHK